MVFNAYRTATNQDGGGYLVADVAESLYRMDAKAKGTSEEDIERNGIIAGTLMYGLIGA